MSARLAYLSGQFVPEFGLSLGYADAGVVSGVTATDFCRTAHGEWFLAGRHRARFRRDCHALGIPLVATDAELAEVADELMRHNRPLTPSPELALISIATPGPLAYLTGTESDGPPTLALHTAPLHPARYAKLFDPGTTVILSGAMPESPHLPAAAKHRSRLHWHLAGKGASLARGEVAALLTPEGFADAAIGSLLAVRGDTVIAAPPGRVLAGVTVEWLREVAASLGLGWDEGGADWHQLAARRGGFTEALIAGSGFGVAPVVAVRGEGGKCGSRRGRWVGRCGFGFPSGGCEPPECAGISKPLVSMPSDSLGGFTPPARKSIPRPAARLPRPNIGGRPA